MKTPKKSKKLTTAAIVLSTEEAMLGTLNRHVSLALELKERTAAKDEKIARLNADFDEEVQAMRAELAVLEASVQLFCVNHREELFPKAKSKEYSNATIGFRENPPAVAKLLANDTFDAIALRLSELEWGEPYVEWECSLKRAELLRDRANFTAQQLAMAGLAFKQDEHFYIAPKSESAERVAVKVGEAA